MTDLRRTHRWHEAFLRQAKRDVQADPEVWRDVWWVADLAVRADAEASRALVQQQATQ